MDTPNAAPVEPAPVEPAPAETDEESFANRLVSSQAKRIFWRFREPLETSVFVLPVNLDPDEPREAYFKPDADGYELHPLSQEPFARNKASSISVKECGLFDWPNIFYEMHYEHDDMRTEELEEEQYMTERWRCSGCGTLAPKKHEPIVVEASEKPYVTVHDFITAVHPWLMSLRDEMAQAKNQLHGRNPCPPLGDNLLVTASQFNMVQLDDEEKWLKRGRQLRERGWVFDVDRGFHVPQATNK